MAASNNGRGIGASAVVFADHARWGAFTQLAAVVRNAGHRTVRVTTTPGTWYNRLIDRLLFDRSIYVTDPGAFTEIGTLLAGEKVVDLQCTEYICARLPMTVDPGLDERIGQSLQRRRTLLDKFTVGEIGLDRGVRVPEKVAADLASPEEAVKQIGVPLVVKSRVGASGDRVRIAASVDEVRRALVDFGPDLTELFYERYVEGDLVDYSAVVGTIGVIQELATRTVVTNPNATTPPREVELVDDPRLIEFGNFACEQFGFSGVVHMDTVRDRDGRYWLLDLNLRAWGSMISCEAAHIDLGAGYLYSVGLSAQPPKRRSPDTGIVVSVFPGLLDDFIEQRRVFAALSAFARHSPRYLRRLGLRYGLSELLTLGVGLAGAWQTRASRLTRSEDQRGAF